jgi:glycerol kinase
MYARGAILGLTRYTTKAHLVRATLEAICYQVRDVLEAMTDDAGVALSALKVDGGAAANNVLMQLQAAVIGTPVVRPTVRETTSLGAAYLAGLAAGVWSDLPSLLSQWQAERTFLPAWEEARRAEGYRGWKRAIERSKGWLDPG